MMDARIAERRDRVRSSRRRHRLRRTLIVVGVLGLAILAVAIERSPLVELSEVRVQGTQRADPDTIRAAADLPLGTSILRLDLDDAERRVESLPLVADASARRADALTVEITVRERQPVAVVAAGERRVLVDAEGMVMAAGAEPSLPVIAVVEGAVPEGIEPVAGQSVDVIPAVANAHAVLVALPGPLRTSVARYEAAGPDELELVLSDGVRVRFGRATRVEEKARALGAVLEDAAGSGAAVIDVRAPGNPVVSG